MIARRRYPFGRLRTWLLLRLLGRYCDALEAQGKERCADAVLDLMDGLEGWCHPSRRLT